MTADALQRGQHLGDGGAPPFEGLAQPPLAVVERLEAAFGFDDPVLGVAQPRRAIDQSLVEFAPVLADGLDLLPQLGLGLGGLLLLGADCLQFLVSLAQGIER